MSFNKLAWQVLFFMGWHVIEDWVLLGLALVLLIDWIQTRRNGGSTRPEISDDRITSQEFKTPGVIPAHEQWA